MEMNRVYESMIKITLRGHWSQLWPKYTLRVWREQPDRLSFRYATTDNNDIRQLVAQLCSRYDLNQVVERVANFSRVSAVELLDAKGNGVLIYPDWK